MSEVHEILFCLEQGGKVSAYPKTSRSLEIGKALQRELKKACEIIQGLSLKEGQSELSLRLNEREARYYHCLVEAIRRYVDSPETFGKCQKCLKDIPLERLKTVPVCKHCVPCKLK